MKKAIYHNNKIHCPYCNMLVGRNDMCDKDFSNHRFMRCIKEIPEKERKYLSDNAKNNPNSHFLYSDDSAKRKDDTDCGCSVIIKDPTPLELAALKYKNKEI